MAAPRTILVGIATAILVAGMSAWPLIARTPSVQVRPQATGPVLEWPSPPEPARIRFVRSLNPAAALGKPSALSRVWHAIVGGGDVPRLAQPYGIAVGPDQKVYVADTTGRAIHVFDLGKPGYIRIPVAGTSLIGIGVAGGQLFVTDSTSGRLMSLDERGRSRWTLGPKDGFLRPTGLVTAPDRMYVVDTMGHRVVMVSLTGQIIGSFGTRGSEPGQFNFPTNIARGADGRLYVTDTMNFRVQIFDATGRFLRTFGQLGDGSGDFDKPKGIAVDSDGHIYVVEGFHDVVQIFDETGHLLLAVGSSGSGDGQFWLPTGIAIANDVMYVADSANQRLEVFQYLKAGQ
jgi:DNA-binding beta-propeller fold protein YncE